MERHILRVGQDVGTKMARRNVSSDNVKKVYSQTLQINSYSVYLSGGLGKSEDYIEWLNILNTAEPEDIFTMYINSYGGYTATAIQLASAMRNTQAEVHTSVSGDCCSAATMLLLTGDSISVAPNLRFLIHNYSGGIYGKGHEIHAQAAFDEAWSKTLLENSYKHFLTPEEIDRVAKGEDMWMDSDEVVLRCEVLLEEREKENGSKKENEQL